MTFWRVIGSLVDQPGGVDVDAIEKEITARLKKSFAADFNGLEQRLETLEKNNQIDEIAKRLAALEKSSDKN